jgi:hypothetical protein
LRKYDYFLDAHLLKKLNASLTSTYVNLQRMTVSGIINGPYPHQKVCPIASTRTAFERPLEAGMLTRRIMIQFLQSPIMSGSSDTFVRWLV